MSVVRLSGEGRGLWLHSPVALDRRLREMLDALGRVRFVVCPNRGHHMFAGEYFAAYPDASVYAAPGLSEKRPDLPFHGVLGDEPEPGWGQDLEQTIFRGEQLLREVVFYHRESRTLIVTDLVQSADSGSPLLTRLAMRLMGVSERPGPPLHIRLGFRDKAAARASLERVLSLDFDGSCSPTGRSWRPAGKPSCATPTRSSRERWHAEGTSAGSGPPGGMGQGLRAYSRNSSLIFDSVRLDSTYESHYWALLASW